MKNMASGTVSRHGSGYQYRGRYENGAQFRKIGFATKKEAKDALVKLMRESATGEALPPTQITTHGWLDSWLKAGALTWKPTTYDGHYDTVRHRIKPHLRNVKLQDLREEHVRAAYGALVIGGYSTNTIKGAARRLKKALNVAVEERKVSYNVALSVVVPKGKPQRETNTWSFDELGKFLDTLESQHDYALWLFFLTTGLRRGEISGLRWPKVDLDAEIAYVDTQRTVTPGGRLVEQDVKTESGEREIPLDPGMVSALRTWRARQSEERLVTKKWKGEDFVFTSVRHTPTSPRAYRHRLNNLCALAGVPRLTPHELRHTFGTLAAENGMDIKVLSKILGHSRVETTMNLYVHPKTEQKKAEAGKLTARMLGSRAVAQ